MRPQCDAAGFSKHPGPLAHVMLQDSGNIFDLCACIAAPGGLGARAPVRMAQVRAVLRLRASVAGRPACARLPFAHACAQQAFRHGLPQRAQSSQAWPLQQQHLLLPRVLHFQGFSSPAHGAERCSQAPRPSVRARARVGALHARAARLPRRLQQACSACIRLRRNYQFCSPEAAACPAPIVDSLDGACVAWTMEIYLLQHLLKMSKLLV